MSQHSIALLLAAATLLALCSSLAAAQGPTPAPAPAPVLEPAPAAAPAFPPPGTVLGSTGVLTNAAGGQHFRVCTSDFPPMSTCNVSAPATEYGEVEGQRGSKQVNHATGALPALLRSAKQAPSHKIVMETISSPPFRRRL